MAWASNLDWGFNKHPPLSAFAVEIFYKIFGNRDWAYYLLSQIFVIISFFVVYKFSEEFLKNKNFAFLSVLLLEGIYFYNFTTPEFNVNVAQLPFWALSVYLTWRCIKSDKAINFLLLGLFIGLGFLTKYLFIYLILGIKLAFIYFIVKEKKLRPSNYLLAGPIALLVIFPHLIWLTDNNFITITYGLQRTGGVGDFFDHLIYPFTFSLKQALILVPFFLMTFFIITKFKFKINLRDRKLVFLLFTTLVPVLLILATSMIMGVKIRTMWMTPFYLFFGVLLLYLLKNKINLKRLKSFSTVFLILFFLSPITYAYISLSEENKEQIILKEISRLVQNRWDKNFTNEISIVVGDEWFAGNLSYHLRSRPLWFNNLSDVKNMKIDGGVIYTGSPKVLKKLCPGVYGTIKPIGICMIGSR